MTKPQKAEALDAGISFIVAGDIPSLKNILRVGKGGQFYHANDAVKLYKRSFFLQLPAKYRRLKIEGAVEVGLTIYQKDRRKDGHNQMATVFDCLEDSEIILNDRQITAWACETRIDRETPRVVVKLVSRLPK